MVTSTPSTSHERSTPSTPITTLHMTTTTKAHPEYTPTEEISTTVTTTATVTVTTHPESPERQKPGVGEILTYTFGVVIGTTLFLNQPSINVYVFLSNMLDVVCTRRLIYSCCDCSYGNFNTPCTYI